MLKVASDQIYAPTPLGQRELTGGATWLANAELDLLVRLDGKQTLSVISRSMAAVGADDFAVAFLNLRDRGLIAIAAGDAFEAQLQFSLDRFKALEGQPLVDQGLFYLRQAGYFCGIARPRPAGARVRAPEAALTALVIEDEPILGKFIQSYLQFEGIQSRVAATLSEMRTQLREGPPPDLLLLDVMLPDANGFDILRGVRAHAVLKETPVIMLTGKATREAVLQGMEAGADGYVTKPFEAEALMRAVRTVLDLPAPAAEAADPWTNADAKAKRAT